MKARHPFVWLSEPGQKRAFVAWTALALVVMAGLQLLGGPLQTEAAPAGIVSFEFAGEITKAQGMVESWGQRGQVVAGLNLGLDYLFMVAYAGAIGLGCVLVGRSYGQRAAAVAWLGIALSWGLWLAALLDAVENYSLIRVLLGSAAEVWPALARWCALLKFVLVGAGLAYVLLGSLLLLAWGKRGRDRGG